MDQERLNQIADKLGIPVDEVQKIQLDSEPYDGKVDLAKKKRRRWMKIIAGGLVSVILSTQSLPLTIKTANLLDYPSKKAVSSISSYFPLIDFDVSFRHREISVKSFFGESYHFAKLSYNAGFQTHHVKNKIKRTRDGYTLWHLPRRN